MRKDTPSPESIAVKARHEETVKDLEARVDIYMSAKELSDIPAVDFFKGLQNEEILAELCTSLYRNHLNEIRIAGGSS